MNWATQAPETRLYKGKSLYRWDVSPGLEHHCGTCETPLHNSRAKTSCIGKHVEPCYRFHQQLHFIGRSHECFGCNTSDEMHHARHKEILVIMRKISVIDEVNRPSPASDSPCQTKSRRGSAFSSSATPTDCSSDLTEDAPRLRRSERKKAKKDSGSTKRNVEAFPKEDIDFISEAIHLSIHETKGGWEGSYVYVNKHTDSEESIAEVDEEGSVADSMNSLSVKPPSGLAHMTPRQRKVNKKFSAPAKHSDYRGGTRKYSPKGGASDLFDGVDPEIFFRLGVEVVNPIKNSATRKELITKLVAVIKNDLEIIKQEDRETIVRQEGFFRWSGKVAYQAIMDTRIGLDWATGQKIGKPQLSERNANHLQETFLDPEDADMEDFMLAMTDVDQGNEEFRDYDAPIMKQENDFAVKPKAIPVTIAKVEDNNHGWETPPAKKVVRKRRPDSVIKESTKVFRSEGKTGDVPTLRIVAN